MFRWADSLRVVWKYKCLVRNVINGKKMKHKHNLIWIDLEMTGLLPETDRIIELATVVTDAVPVALLLLASLLLPPPQPASAMSIPKAINKCLLNCIVTKPFL